MPTNAEQLIQSPDLPWPPAAEASSIVSIAEDRAVKKAEKIFEEGDKGDGLYVVLEGTVSVPRRTRPAGSRSWPSWGTAARWAR